MENNFGNTGGSLLYHIVCAYLCIIVFAYLCICICIIKNNDGGTYGWRPNLLLDGGSSHLSGLVGKAGVI